MGCRIVEFHRQVEAKTLLQEELTLTDVLTGLPNRRAIEIWAQRESFFARELARVGRALQANMSGKLLFLVHSGKTEFFEERHVVRGVEFWKFASAPTTNVTMQWIPGGVAPTYARV